LVIRLSPADAAEQDIFRYAERLLLGILAEIDGNGQPIFSAEAMEWFLLVSRQEKARDCFM
jgi:hypothetical protein